MSTLKVTDIQSNSASFNTPVVFKTSGGTENGKLIKTWVNFNGQGTIAIRDSFNVNTITDRGVGRYDVNLVNALSSANYCVAGTANGARWLHAHNDANPSTTSINVGSTDWNGNMYDPNYANCMVCQN